MAFSASSIRYNCRMDLRSIVPRRHFGFFISSLASVAGAAPGWEPKATKIIDDAVKPVMEQYGIPGMAVGVTFEGRRHFVEYGAAEKTARVPVTRDTLFELGSISKTFTATLATYAEIEGKLRLSDSVSQYMPELKGSALDQVRLLDLATHTAGGFPLQLPDEVTNQEQLIAYFRSWKPKFDRGTYRSYANPSIGLLGMIVARRMGVSFQALMEGRLFPEIGLRRTYINVPSTSMASYAWGYNRENKPIRVAPGMLDKEAYGVKSNTLDMIRYVEVNMGIGRVPMKISRAVEATHTGYFRAGELIQSLIWEQYPYPVDLDKLLAGNSPKVIFESIPATVIEQPITGRKDVILNKTGSTNGFGAYVAFVPSKKIGIVMLANKNYPIDARVKAAYRVLSGLSR